MKEKKACAVRFGAAALAALCLTAGAAMAAGSGSQSDPLVTLSYLTQTATPAVLEQVDAKVTAYQQQLVDKLDLVVSGYATKMEELAVEQSGEENAAVYSVMTLKKGQKLSMEIGCEVMLRVGTAQCVSSSDHGLINITNGASLNNGQELTMNNLYMATIDGRGVQATADTVKVLVRGSFTIE